MILKRTYKIIYSNNMLVYNIYLKVIEMYRYIKEVISVTSENSVPKNKIIEF
ncbi:hypothetical protein SDC9_08577 [bioreactor metagenome]|uniref:Uncharacterized protein n=1 Tax=bioreactor metagenome TaxID=1076179 RepID=A0A644T8Z6_9ZZZZ